MKEKFIEIIGTFNSYISLLKSESAFTEEASNTLLQKMGQLFGEAQYQSSNQLIFLTEEKFLDPNEITTALLEENAFLNSNFADAYTLFCTTCLKNAGYLTSDAAIHKEAAKLLEGEVEYIMANIDDGSDHSASVSSAAPNSSAPPIDVPAAPLYTASESGSVLTLSAAQGSPHLYVKPASTTQILPDAKAASDLHASAPGSPGVHAEPASAQHHPPAASTVQSLAPPSPSNAANLSSTEVASSSSPDRLVAKKLLQIKAQERELRRQSRAANYRQSLADLKNTNMTAEEVMEKVANAAKVKNTLAQVIAAQSPNIIKGSPARKNKEPTARDLAWKKDNSLIKITRLTQLSNQPFFNDYEYREFATWFAAYFQMAFLRMDEVANKNKVFEINRINKTEESLNEYVPAKSLWANYLLPQFFSCELIITYESDEGTKYTTQISVNKREVILKGHCTTEALMALLLASAGVFKSSGEMTNLSVPPLRVVGCSQYFQEKLKGLWLRLININFILKQPAKVELEDSECFSSPSSQAGHLQIDDIASLRLLPTQYNLMLLKKTISEIQELFSNYGNQSEAKPSEAAARLLKQLLLYLKSCDDLIKVLDESASIKNNKQYQVIFETIKSLRNKILGAGFQVVNAPLEIIVPLFNTICENCFVILKKLLEIEGITLLSKERLENPSPSSPRAEVEQAKEALKQIKEIDDLEWLPHQLNSNLVVKTRNTRATKLIPRLAVEKVAVKLLVLLESLENLNTNINNDSVSKINKDTMLQQVVVQIGTSFKDLENNSNGAICLFNDRNEPIRLHEARVLLDKGDLAAAIKNCYLIYLRLHKMTPDAINKHYLEKNNHPLYVGYIRKFRELLHSYISTLAAKTVSSAAPQLPAPQDTAASPLVIKSSDENWSPEMEKLLADLLLGADSADKPSKDKVTNQLSADSDGDDGDYYFDDQAIAAASGDRVDSDVPLLVEQRVFRVGDAEGHFINLIENKIPGDGQCGFKALKSDRSAFGQVLLGGVNDEQDGQANREMIIEDIHEYFQNFVAKIAVNNVDISALQLPQKLELLTKIGVPENLRNDFLQYLFLCRNIDANAEQIKALLSTVKVANAFIQYAYIDGPDYLSTFSIKLYAKLQQIKVCIYKEYPTPDGRNRIELSPGECYQPPAGQEPRGEYYLLETGDLKDDGAIHYNHFNQLRVLESLHKVKPIKGIAVATAVKNAEMSFQLSLPYTGPSPIKIIHELEYLLQLMRKKKKQPHQFNFLKRPFLTDHDEYERIKREADDPNTEWPTQYKRKLQKAIYIDNPNKYHSNIDQQKAALDQLLVEAVKNLPIIEQQRQVRATTVLSENELKKLPTAVLAIRKAIACLNFINSLHADNPNYHDRLNDIEHNISAIKQIMRINGSDDPYKSKKLPPGHHDYKKETREFAHHPYTQIEKVGEGDSIKLELVEINEHVKLEKRRVAADNLKREVRIIIESVIVGIICLLAGGFLTFVFGLGFFVAIVVAALTGVTGGLLTYKARDHATQHWYLKEFRSITRNIDRKDYNTDAAKESNLIGIIQKLIKNPTPWERLNATKYIERRAEQGYFKSPGAPVARAGLPSRVSYLPQQSEEEDAIASAQSAQKKRISVPPPNPSSIIDEGDKTNLSLPPPSPRAKRLAAISQRAEEFEQQRIALQASLSMQAKSHIEFLESLAAKPSDARLGQYQKMMATGPSYLDRMVKQCKEIADSVKELLLKDPKADPSIYEELLYKALQEIDVHLYQNAQLQIANEATVKEPLMEREEFAAICGQLVTGLQQNPAVNFNPAMDKLKKALDKLQLQTWQATMQKMQDDKSSLSSEQRQKLKVSMATVLDEKAKQFKTNVEALPEVQDPDLLDDQAAEPLQNAVAQLSGDITAMETIVDLFTPFDLTPEVKESCRRITQITTACKSHLTPFSSAKRIALLDAAQKLANEMQTLLEKCKPLIEPIEPRPSPAKRKINVSIYGSAASPLSSVLVEQPSQASEVSISIAPPPPPISSASGESALLPPPGPELLKPAPPAQPKAPAPPRIASGYSPSSLFRFWKGQESTSAAQLPVSGAINADDEQADLEAGEGTGPDESTGLLKPKKPASSAKKLARKR